MNRLISLTICLALLFCGCSRDLGASSKPAASRPESKSESKSESSLQLLSSAAAENPASKSPAASESSSSHPVPESERDWRLLLVNPEYPLPDDFSVELSMTKYGYEVDSRIVSQVDTLIDAAKADGVTLIICYGYRTLEQSQQLFDKQLKKQLARGLSQDEALAEAKRWVAPPGTSDHHTGLALDIVTPEHQVLNHEFFDTPAGRWMAAHSWEYGFVIRFPEDKQDITGITYEPWHLRYVGAEHAKAMHENNECLEEYVARLYGES